MTMDELTAAVSAKALVYLQETDEDIESCPASVVDFAIEYAIESIHFSATRTDVEKATLLGSYVNVLAMMCVDLYVKAGSEGEKSHSEGNVNRQYESAWISPRLIDRLPNYVQVPSTVRR